MKTVDSDALGEITRALGITGRGSQITEFLDGQLDQVVDVAALIRRGRTQAGTGGFYFGVLQNNHVGAETEVSTINPYDVAVGAVAPYPAPMPKGFDIWILGASVDQVSGTGTFTGALFLEPRLAQGWGIDEAGVAVIPANSAIPLAFWDSVVTETREFALMEDGQPFKKIGLRLVRPAASNSGITFSSTSSADSVFNCFVLLGVFPIGLGQDLLV